LRPAFREEEETVLEGRTYTPTKDLEYGILTQLECPFCKQYMLPPITLCENAHNICFRCLPQLRKCPICNGLFQREHNIALENIARQIYYPCRQRRFGCLEVLTWDKIEGHEEDCSFGVYGCPIYEDEDIGCPWKGPLFELKGHLISKHGNKYWEVSDTLTQQVIDMREGVFYDTAIYTMGELFYRRIENTSNGFYGYVQYIGPKKLANKYKYKLSLQKSYGPEKLTVCHITSDCWKSKRDIYKTKKCLQISSSVMEYFVSEDRTLKIVTRFSKVPSFHSEQ
jgi:hypothetical protein